MNRRTIIRLYTLFLVLGAILAAQAPGSTAFIAAPASATRQVAANTQIFVPFAVLADPYADWVSLGQPAGGAAVNYLYVGQACAGQAPATILAGTDAGLYSYNGAWARNTGLNANMMISHILNTPNNGLFVASYNFGTWRSPDGGATWVQQSFPGVDLRTYWLAATDQYIYAAGLKGLYRQSTAGGAWVKIRSGAIYTVAAAGSTVYAAEIGDAKDTLWISADGGDTWPISRQLPGAVNFVQTLDTAQGSPQVLIGAVDGGLFTLDGANNIVPFSQGTGQTVYGIWRDTQGRIYAALDAPGGLRRFPKSGGASDRDLSALPGGASLATAALYTVNGSTACNILGVGSEGGGVWLRRAP
jgi:hypothetical protein